MDELVDIVWPVAVWLAENPARIVYCLLGAIVVGFSASWAWHNRKGK